MSNRRLARILLPLAAMVGAGLALLQVRSANTVVHAGYSDRGPQLLAARTGSSPSASLDEPARSNKTALSGRTKALEMLELEIPPFEIYKAENRDERWAPAMEANIAEHLDHDLATLAGARTKTVVCHWETCMFTVTGPVEKMAAINQLIRVGPLAQVLAPVGSESDTDATFVLVFEEAHKNLDAYATWYQQTRQRHLEALREQAKQGQLRIPAELLPAN